MKVKDNSVLLVGLKREIVKALPYIEKIYNAEGESLILTCGLNGVHSAGSLHYSGYAVDIRTRMFSEQQKRSVYRKIKEVLGIAYDVILHDSHIHVEFDLI